MKVDSANSYLSSLVGTNLSERTYKSDSGNFVDVLLSRMNGEKDPYAASERKYGDLGEGSRDLFLLATRNHFTHSIQPVETERYKITEEDGFVRIYDKEQNNEFVNFKLNRDKIQVDERTGTKFIINDLGVGFFTMMVVDDELEAGLKEAIGVDELDEKELKGFTVHTDKKTGINYITANGYESGGGLILLDDEARKKLDSLAKEFLQQYPNLARTYNEAWFYATFEVRGLLQRTPNGIMMIGPNSISFKNKDGINGWTMVFDPENWEQVKAAFDSGNAGNIEEWNFWKDFLKL